MRRLPTAATVAAAFTAGVFVAWLLRPAGAPEAGNPAVAIAALELRVDDLSAQVRSRDAHIAALRALLDATPQPVPRSAPDLGSVVAPAPDPVPIPPPQPVRLEGTARAAALSDPAPVDPDPAQAALTRFRRFLERTRGVTWEDRTRQARALVAELQEIGEPAFEALLGVLEQGPDGRERAAAAALLGGFGDSRATAALQAVLDSEDDVLMRRAAARGLQLLRSPEAVPALEGLLATEGEDRFVRLSAAYGLAELGEPAGVPALVRIFEEAEADGRGQFLVFRALVGLKDEQALPLMRRITSSGADASYRLEAIRFLADARDPEAIPILDGILASPREQPSIRSAAQDARDALTAAR